MAVIPLSSVWTISIVTPKVRFLCGLGGQGGGVMLKQLRQPRTGV